METEDDSKKAITLLLERVSVEAGKLKKLYRETGLAYNVFKAAGIDQDEVKMCRVLADLLNSKGFHNQGNAYLKLFMDMVVKRLDKRAGLLNLLRAKVSTEYLINEDRRIDIVFDDGSVFIPIEVKIKAGEKENQLADYAAYSRKMNSGIGFFPVLFLTPNGRDSGAASKNDYIPVSFEKHIVPWLEQCLNLEETKNALPVREMLKQFIYAIKSFCGCLEDEVMEINNLITESRDNYQAAMLIAKAVEKLDFDTKAREIFNGPIYELVKNKFPEVKYVEDGKGDEAWYYLDIPVGKACKLGINFDWQSITVESIDPKTKVKPETIQKITKIMFEKTGVRGKDWGEGCVWACANAKYPGLEDIDEDFYMYELYSSYSKEPQLAADRILSIVTELKNI